MNIKPGIKDRLQHIIDASDRILKFASGMDFKGFLADEVIQLAVIKNFEIIGEAVHRLPQQFKNGHTDIEWRKMEDLGDVLIGDYFSINLEIVWNTVGEKIEILRSGVKQLQEQFD